MEYLNNYNPEGSDLRKMQLRMLEMLTFIDSICEKHNINYWLAYGTLLGAVRHNGFIPWDDDLDIELLKDDYDKLINILKKDLTDNYYLQIHSTDRNYVFPIAKLRDGKSHISENRNADQNYKYRGIYIDIFYIDKGNTFLARATPIIQKLIADLNFIKNDRMKIIPLIRHLLFVLFHRVIFPFLRFLTNIFGLNTLIPPYGTGFTVKRNLGDIFPLKKIRFEGKYFNAPQNTDDYLKELYGDYMKIPPEEKRYTHTLKIKFL